VACVLYIYFFCEYVLYGIKLTCIIIIIVVVVVIVVVTITIVVIVVIAVTVVLLHIFLLLLLCLLVVFCFLCFGFSDFYTISSFLDGCAGGLKVRFSVITSVT